MVQFAVDAASLALVDPISADKTAVPGGYGVLVTTSIAHVMFNVSLVGPPVVVSKFP